MINISSICSCFLKKRAFTQKSNILPILQCFSSVITRHGNKKREGRTCLYLETLMLQGIESTPAKPFYICTRVPLLAIGWVTIDPSTHILLLGRSQLCIKLEDRSGAPDVPTFFVAIGVG